MLYFVGIHDLKIINIIVYALTFIGNYEQPSDLVVDIFLIKCAPILLMSLHACMNAYIHLCLCESFLQMMC